MQGQLFEHASRRIITLQANSGSDELGNQEGWRTDDFASQIAVAQTNYLNWTSIIPSFQFNKSTF